MALPGLKLLAPERVSVPEPDLISLLAPLITPEIEAAELLVTVTEELVLIEAAVKVSDLMLSTEIAFDAPILPVIAIAPVPASSLRLDATSVFSST